MANNWPENHSRADLRLLRVSAPFVFLAIIKGGLRRQSDLKSVTPNPYVSSARLSHEASATRREDGQTSFASVSLGFCLLLMGFLLSYFGYTWGELSPNPDELLGSFLFWVGVVFLLFAFPLRDVARSLRSYLRRTYGAGLLAGYLTVHLFVYGFILAAILTSVYGTGGFTVSSALLVTTNVFYPPSLSSTFFDLAYNPSIVATVPPVFSVELSFYSISVAVVIAGLVVTNVGRTRELGELCTRLGRASSFVLLPTLGIVLGASCCLSVAALLALAAPSVSVLESDVWVYYTTYFVFPPLAGFLLWLNLRSIGRISTRLGSPTPA